VKWTISHVPLPERSMACAADGVAVNVTPSAVQNQTGLSAEAGATLIASITIIRAITVNNTRMRLMCVSPPFPTKERRD
jgi:hypothetical protein